ncbi:peptide deformylase [Nonlabens sp. Hel1_33_55]|uniref:peptide deformylase n=1 Tax=Nonlabens sp. Hel1_33_55 TaxID=1336802 RepID=UPI001E64402B|nr:peptide deformylase [Nonlabens sp. Hel1_33_55]
MKSKIYIVAVMMLVSFAFAKAQQSNQFSNTQHAIIMSDEATAPMRVFKITKESDSLLLRQNSIAVDVDPKDKTLQRLVDRMYATVRDSMSLGAGIAAPQVGVLKRIAWVQRFDKPEFPFEVILNPVIKQYSKKKQECREGCLSIPDRRDTLNSRAYAILVEYDTMKNEHVVEMVEDFTAVIFQHEIDHLNGILYLDHLAEEQREAAESN